jgi:Domain of unknown function (DUF4845)
MAALPSTLQHRGMRHGRGERGITMIGLVFWAIIIAFAALLLMRVFPSVNEYWTLKRAVEKIAKDNPSTVQEVKAAFARQQSVEFSISDINANDLEVTKEGDRLVIRFAYDKSIEIMDPVYLLIKYKGEGRGK